MKTRLATLLILLTVAPLAGQERRLPTPAVARPTPSVGPLGAAVLHAVNGEYVSFMKWFVGGGAVVGALFTMAACDHSDDDDGPKTAKKDPDICGRSAAGSAFNGAILGALSGFFAHIILEKRSHSFSPAVARPVELVTFRVPIGWGR
ncbi:MAG: hypothetical protein F4107_08200 [Gemmatimonadetes bacterium]|nr:hypothetical protein [Gemmatimonadota bacterium]MDE2679404.1 hypothetical protein [Gemmatimonadota bacterium]MXX34873.1 hypothetical protein [Gemmatimonadota bacterium]MYD13904.1 hypothetical protein [Gemmatimonadota bacterium]MYI65900.1 hypothetical protein [Gemmatimonadota bacterium]